LSEDRGFGKFFFEGFAKDAKIESELRGLWQLRA